MYCIISVCVNKEEDRQPVVARYRTHNFITRIISKNTFAHGAMGRRIDTSWGGPIELFLVPASAPRLV